jgi:hypothetical protein
MLSLRILALALLLPAGGCVGTSMTRDPGSGAMVPVQGWTSAAWQDDPAWRPFGAIGKHDFRRGPWWYDDPAWRALSADQGDMPGSSGTGAGESASKAGPAADPPAK